MKRCIATTTLLLVLAVLFFNIPKSAIAQQVTPAGPVDLLPGWGGGIAYNSKNDSYLVVSQKGNNANSIVGRIVSDAGQLLTSEFDINSNNMGYAPRPAYSPDVDKFLVIWADETVYNTSVTDLKGRFVSSSGQPIGISFDIVADLPGSEFMTGMGLLKYDNKNKKFVIVWEHRENGSQVVDVYLATIDLNGNRSGLAKVANQPAYEGNGAVAVNEKTNEYCVAYVRNDNSSPTSKVIVRKVNAQTMAVGPETIVKDSAWGDPHIAYNSDRDEYLVTWQSALIKGTEAKILSACDGGKEKVKEFPLLGNLIYEAKTVYNRQSKTYGLVGGYYNSPVNIFVLLDSTTGQVKSQKIIFLDAKSGGAGNRAMVIAANTKNGSYAAISSRDYVTTRIMTRLFAGAGEVTPNCAPFPQYDDPLYDECLFWAGLVDLDGNNKLTGSLGDDTDPASPVALPINGPNGIGAAYNSSGDLILVATGYQTDIMAVLLDASNLRVIKGPMRLDTNSSFSGYPEVAYSPKKDRFLVVWGDERTNPNSSHMFGRFVGGDGVPEGSDFPIMTNRNYHHMVGLDLNYDFKRDQFIVVYEELGNNTGSSYIRTIDSSGKISSEGSFRSLTTPTGYEFRPSVAYNSGADEYWVAYQQATTSSNKDDNRVFFFILNPTTFQKKSSPVQLSVTNVGKFIGGYAGPEIEYDPVTAGTIVVWDEPAGGGNGIAGIRIEDDGTLGTQFDVVNPMTMPIADYFGREDFAYNPFTESFFVFTEVGSNSPGSAGNVLVELDAYGSILNSKEAIAHAGNGHFWPAMTTTVNGAVGFGALNYGTVKAAKVWSSLGEDFNLIVIKQQVSKIVSYIKFFFEPLISEAMAQAPTTPAAAATGNPCQVKDPKTGQATGDLPRCINQIYRWSLGLVGILAMLMIVYGGYLVMTSAGNAKEATKGKEYIFSSIVGMLLLFASALILNTINSDLTSLNINSIKGLNVAPSSGGGWVGFGSGIGAGGTGNAVGCAAGRTCTEPLPEGVQAVARDQVVALIQQLAQKYGVDPRLADRLAYCESTYIQNAKNPTSSARGVYQFLEGTWDATPEGQNNISPHDAAANIEAAMRIISSPRGTKDWEQDPASLACWGNWNSRTLAGG